MRMKGALARARVTIFPSYSRKTIISAASVFRPPRSNTRSIIEGRDNARALFCIFIENSRREIFFGTPTVHIPHGGASDVASYLFLCRNSHYRGRDATSRKRKSGAKKNAQTEERSRNQVICAPKQEFLVKLSIQFPCFLVKYSVFLSCRFTGDPRAQQKRRIRLIHSLNVLELIRIKKNRSAEWRNCERRCTLALDHRSESTLQVLTQRNNQQSAACESHSASREKCPDRFSEFRARKRKTT